MNLIDSISSKSDKIIAKKNYDLALSGESITTIQEYGEVQKSYYESFYNPIFDENHKIIGATAFSRDISKRILTEKALENEKELAQEYLRIAGVMIIVLDKNGIVTMINKKGCEIIGLEENSIIGKNWFDSFIPKNNTKQIKEVFENVLHKNGELEEVYTNKIINASGEERLILWYNSILYDSDENVIGVLSSGEDITAITETNDKLKESENRYRQLTNNLEAGIVVHASDTSIISFNKKAEQILGLGYKELSGETSDSSNFRFFGSDL
jgi:PAS domain S-box-containing protein